MTVMVGTNDSPNELFQAQVPLTNWNQTYNVVYSAIVYIATATENTKALPLCSLFLMLA